MFYQALSQGKDRTLDEILQNLQLAVDNHVVLRSIGVLLFGVMM